jgi:hypothetical protein
MKAMKLGYDEARMQVLIDRSEVEAKCISVAECRKAVT